MSKLPLRPGALIRERLAEFKITRRRLAEHLGWTLRQINAVCDDETPMTAKRAILLGAALVIPPEALMRARTRWELREGKEGLKREGGKYPGPLGARDIPANKRRKHPLDRLAIGEQYIVEYAVCATDEEKQRQTLASKQQSVHARVRAFNERYGTQIKIATRDLGDGRLLIIRII